MNVCIKTLLGSDSHTPTGGAIGMLSIGAVGRLIFIQNKNKENK